MTDNSSPRQRPSLTALWAGWWIAGLAWVIHLGGSFVLVDWFCHNDSAVTSGKVLFYLHGLTLLCVALALGGAAVAARNVRLLRRAHAGDTVGRGWFLAIGGVMMSLFLLVIILIEAIPNWILRPCL